MSDNEPEMAPEAENYPDRLTQEEIWLTAKKFHELMAEDVRLPGDLIGVCAIMFTNQLMAAIMSGADMEFVDTMLGLVRDDVENGVKHLQNAMNTVQ